MGKNKKDKKSKKQRKKELEEKRRLEEELLKQQQEEERKKQEELAQKRREEEERLRLLKEKKRKEELVRLSKENEEDIDKIIEYENNLKKFEMEQSQQIEWKKHLKCAKLWDISNNRELNNFLTIWKEYEISDDILFNLGNKNNNNLNKNKFEIKYLKYYINDIENGYKLLQILQDVIYDSIQRENISKLNYAKSKYIEIGNIAQNKIDDITQKCLRDDYFTSVADAGMKEDGDVIKYINNNNIKYGLWGSSMSNAFKNTKIDQFSSSSSVDGGVIIELPKQIAMKAKMALSLRMIEYKYNFYVFNNTNIKYECIGPVLDIQLLKLPSPPRDLWGSKSSNKSSNNWLVQYITDDDDVIKPTKYEYANQNEITDIKSAESIQITYTIPNNIILPYNYCDSSNIVLGWWDDINSKWNPTHFKDVSFNKDKRNLSFTTCHLSPICLLQERGIYYKYKDWKLTPSGVERCKLSLTTSSSIISKIEIEIVGGLCQLLSPNLPQLSSIYKKLILPHKLIRLLKNVGINLCDHEESDTKNTSIKSRANFEISTISSLFEVSMSKWNNCVNDSDIIIFKLRKPLTRNEEVDLLNKKETEEKEEKEKDDKININDDHTWLNIQISTEKCTFIDCSEQSKNINLNTPNRELSHINLLRCLTSYCGDDNIRDLENTSFRFKETIKRILNLLNLWRV